MRQNHIRRVRGFTLLEMAVVLVIMGLILGGLVTPIAMQVEQRNVIATQATLDNVKEALIGYAMANGRFPCPAAPPGPGITGVEAPANAGTSGTACTNALNGYVPGTTLGLAPVNASGYVLDGWNNPIRYAISSRNDGTNFVFTNLSGMKNANTGGCPNCGMSWISTQSQAAPYLLSICNTATGIVPPGNCASAATTITTNAVFVVYSLGKNFATGGTGADEAANLDNDTAFIDHPPTPSGAANGEYDDIMSWVSTSTIFSRMVQAGQLP